MSNTRYIHAQSSYLYSYALYTYAAGYIFNLILKPYLRHMQMCNDYLFYGYCMHMLKFERSVQLMKLSNYSYCK